MRRNKLRNLGGFLSGYIAVLVVAICAIATMCSCEQIRPVGEQPDSVYVADYVNNIVNPSFASLQEVQVFQNRLAEEYSVDETFRTMPHEVLNNVASVCLKKNVLITKKDIVAEYTASRAVYDNLPTTDESTPNTITEDSSTAVEEQQKPVGKVSYRYELDTINGQPKRVLIKEERTYE